jgi:hypothetical protein
MKNHKWSIRNDKTRRLRDNGVAQCIVCNIYRQYINGKAEYWDGDDHLPKRPNCSTLKSIK